MEQHPGGERPMNEDYRRQWQEYYADNPYTEADREQDTSAKEYAEATLGVFEEVGIVENMRQHSFNIVASSVSTGNKDQAFLQALDARLDAGAPRSRVLMTDYAVKSDGQPVIEQPAQPLEHLSVQSMVSDAYHMPLADGSVDVLYERAGALFHAADEDREHGHGGELVGRMLAEYQRILKPEGQIIIDWANSGVPVSTALELEKAAPAPLEDYLHSQGYNVHYAGDKEGYLVLTKR